MKTKNKVLIFIAAYLSVLTMFCLYCRKFMTGCKCCCGSKDEE